MKETTPTVEGFPRPALGPDHAETWERLVALAARLGHADPESLSPESELGLDAGLDSLGLVELLLAIEEEFGVELSEAEVGPTTTLSELLSALERTEPTTQAPTFPRWGQSAPATACRAAVQRLVLFPLHSLVARPLAVEGRENLTGLKPPLLFLANHTSHLDALTLLRALPGPLRRRTAVAAAADYFYANPIFGGAVSLLLGAFPFSRKGAVKATMAHCQELAHEGWNLLVFPEGTRSLDGKLGQLMPGAGLLARSLQITVVPVHLAGLYDVLPKGRFWPRRGPVQVRFGEAFRVVPGQDHREIAALARLQILRLAGHDGAL